jgi:hypothetical protein
VEELFRSTNLSDGREGTEAGFSRRGFGILIKSGELKLGEEDKVFEQGDLL